TSPDDLPSGQVQFARPGGADVQASVTSRPQAEPAADTVFIPPTPPSSSADTQTAAASPGSSQSNASEVMNHVASGFVYVASWFDMLSADGSPANVLSSNAAGHPSAPDGIGGGAGGSSEGTPTGGNSGAGADSSFGETQLTPSPGGSVPGPVSIGS